MTETEKMAQKQVWWNVKKKSPTFGGGWQVRRLKIRWQKESADGGATLFGSFEYAKGEELKGRFDSADVTNAYIDPKSDTKFFITVDVNETPRVYEFHAVNSIERQGIMENLIQAFPEIFADSLTIPTVPLNRKSNKNMMDAAISSDRLDESEGRRGRFSQSRRATKSKSLLTE